MGTPREIQERTLSTSVIEIEIAQPLGDMELPVWPEADKANIFDGRTHIAVTSHRPARTIVAMVKWLDDHGIELSDIRIKRPSLEEAFIELTGKSLRE
jgi:ABC-2 type transport system ATP-binding protein